MFIANVRDFLFFLESAISGIILFAAQINITVHVLVLLTSHMCTKVMYSPILAIDYVYYGVSKTTYT